MSNARKGPSPVVIVFGGMGPLLPGRSEISREKKNPFLVNVFAYGRACMTYKDSIRKLKAENKSS